MSGIGEDHNCGEGKEYVLSVMEDGVESCAGLDLGGEHLGLGWIASWKRIAFSRLVVKIAVLVSQG